VRIESGLQDESSQAELTGESQRNYVCELGTISGLTILSPKYADRWQQAAGMVAGAEVRQLPDASETEREQTAGAYGTMATEMNDDIRQTEGADTADQFSLDRFHQRASHALLGGQKVVRLTVRQTEAQQRDGLPADTEPFYSALEAIKFGKAEAYPTPPPQSSSAFYL
jgi:hypothetical protein